MKERPILMNGAMVRAVLAGTKTQTRRAVKPSSGPHTIEQVISTPDSLAAFIRHHCPYGQPGDRLWVRETWRARAIGEGGHCERGPYVYRATENVDGIAERWRPSIHMPRWASRITLKIVSVRVERLNEISEKDALEEGITYNDIPNNGLDPMRARTWFRGLWQSINGPGSRDANPWVWVVEFKPINPTAEDFTQKVTP